jgi:hypothetical protein
MLLCFTKISFWFATVVPKYLKFATFSNTYISYLYVMILPCILFMKQWQILSFLCIYFYTNLLPNVNYSFCVLPNKFTSLAETNSSRVSFHFSLRWFSWTFLMAYSKAKLESNGDKASLCFRPFWIGNVSDKCSPMGTLLQVPFQHIAISPSSFVGTPNSMTILYSTSLLTETPASFKYLNGYCTCIFPPVSDEGKYPVP